MIVKFVTKCGLHKITYLTSPRTNPYKTEHPISQQAQITGFNYNKDALDIFSL